jgi:hypothetical protein
VARATVEVATGIGRRRHHTRPQGCKRLRDDGGPAAKPYAQGTGGIPAALAKGEGVVQGAIKSIARVTSRQRYEGSTGRAPLICPPCRSAMGLGCLWHPTYGVIDDEGQGIKRGTHTLTTQQAGP